MGLMGYQFVLNIVFVLKIQIEGTFGNPGLFYDIGDSSGVDAFGGKQFIGGIKKRFLLFFLFSSTFPIISVLLGFYYNQSFPLSAISITEK